MIAARAPQLRRAPTTTARAPGRLSRRLPESAEERLAEGADGAPASSVRGIRWLRPAPGLAVDLLAACLALGCSLGPVPSTRFYRLAAPMPAEAESIVAETTGSAPRLATSLSAGVETADTAAPDTNVSASRLGAPAPAGVETAAEVPNKNAHAPRLSGVLVVERFAADGLASERPILYSNPTSLEVRQHRYHHWVEPPTDMLQHQLVSYLQAASVASVVTTPEARVRPDFVLRGRISRFERLLADDGVRVHIEARASLTHAAERRVLWSETYRVEEPAEGRDVAASVAAFNRGVSEIFVRIARGIGGQ